MILSSARLSTRGSVSRSTRSPTRSVGKTSSHASLLKRKTTAFGSSFGLKGVLFAAAKEEGVSRFGTTYPFLFSCSTILYEITSEPEDEELDRFVRSSCHASNVLTNPMFGREIARAFFTLSNASSYDKPSFHMINATQIATEREQPI